MAAGSFTMAVGFCGLLAVGSLDVGFSPRTLVTFILSLLIFAVLMPEIPLCERGHVSWVFQFLKHQTAINCPLSYQQHLDATLPHLSTHRSSTVSCYLHIFFAYPQLCSSLAVGGCSSAGTHLHIGVFPSMKSHRYKNFATLNNVIIFLLRSHCLRLSIFM